ncbi:MAG TPA: SulP family inorganic anion transporter [Acidimicrobiia bacterium]|jgi:SulP family sulfate permease|nr:SulP family inorganic anion transporter [Acidimicrobiia bacterium]HIL46928.1 SulP family inorganic anion transporter [Acidimicrobiia bacterium]
MSENILVDPPSRLTGIDVVAGLSVVLVLIPQSMAYAELAGLPPYLGLFASALPLIAASFFASSPYLQTGPVAMTCLLIFGALSGLATPGSAEYIRLATLLAFVVGVTRLIFGFLKWGRVTYLMTNQVVAGFTSGATLLIIASQLPKIFGTAPPSGGILRQAWWSLSQPGQWGFRSLAFAGVTVVLMLGGRRMHRLFPGALVAVLGGVIWVKVVGFGGPVVGTIATGFPPLSLDLPWDQTGTVLVSGVVIALVGFAEVAAISRVFAEEENQRWSVDREFLSQGFANLTAAFCSSFPVGGSFGRSALNRLSGAQTRWSGLVTGVAVLAFLPFAGSLEVLPRATLGGVVFAAVVGLVKPKKLWRLIQNSAGDALVAGGTFVATLALAPRVERAVILGALLSLATKGWARFGPKATV